MCDNLTGTISIYRQQETIPSVTPGWIFYSVSDSFQVLILQHARRRDEIIIPPFNRSRRKRIVKWKKTLFIRDLLFVEHNEFNGM
jgi:hypothetical protein